MLNSIMIDWILNAYAAFYLVTSPAGFLLQEDGFYILQENLDRIVL